MNIEKNKTANSASIGALLLDAGKISVTDAERIIALQKQKNLRFGDAAKQLGLINEDDIQKVLSTQFDFPYLDGSEENFSRDLVAAYQPFSTQVEAFRAIRGQIILRCHDTHKTIPLVSYGREEGKSFMAANLAIVFSQLGEKTLLIDADLRHPNQHNLFKLKNDYGLSDILAGRISTDVIHKIPAFRDLSVLTAGTTPPNPIELLSRGFKNCLKELQPQFDVILIDTSACELGIDAQTVSGYAGKALLLARQDHTKINELQSIKEDFLESGSQCIGSIILNF